MPVEINDLIRNNRTCIDLLESAEDLLERQKGALATEDQFPVLMTIADIQTRLRVLKFTQIHLKASAIVVEFDDAEAAKLSDLERQLDGFIIRDAEVNAVLASVPPLMNAAIKIDAIINAHIARG